MNLTNLTDEILLTQTKRVVAREREILTEVLHHLHEIDRRKLFAKLRYRSLFDYATKELAYSEDQAYRRISAARLLEDVPEIETKLNSGALTLASLSVAAQALRAQNRAQKKMKNMNLKKTRGPDGIISAAAIPKTKREILSLVENKSKREAEEIVLGSLALDRNALKPEKVFVKENHLELRLTISKECEEKIQRLKEKFAHSNPRMSTAELLEKLCGEELARQEKKMEPKAPLKLRVNTQARGKNQIISNISSNCAVFSENQKALQQELYSSIQMDPPTNPFAEPSAAIATSPTATRTPITKRKSLPTSTKKIIWQRDRGRCTNCGSRYALEFDHIVPKSKGGPDNEKNIRLLCRPCNQRAAIESFSTQKMQRYFSRKLV